MNTRISKMLVCGHDRVAGLTVDGRVLCHGAYDSSDEDYQCSSVTDHSGSDLTTQVFFGGTTSVTMDVHGRLSSAGTDDYEQASPVADWKGPFADVVCQFRHTVGLRKDGTVVACGWNDFHQCNVSGWRDITAIAAGLFHTVGLRKDGTVVGCGDNGDHQLDIQGWRNVIAIACSDNHTVGLKSDGTVVACGASEDGAFAVSGWKDIVKVACGSHYTLGLKNDGTVVACGVNETGVNALGGRCDVGSWTDVKDIVCADYYALGLRNDGTVLFTGENNNGVADVRKWTDIVHIVCNELAVFGLKRNGTVVTCGTGDFFTYEPVTRWKLFSNYETVDEDFEESLNRRKAAAAASKKPVSSGSSQSTTTYSSTPKKSGKGCVWVLVILGLLIGGGWYLLKQGVPLDFLKKESTTQTTAPSYPAAYVALDQGLRLRTGPGTSHDIITTMPKGSEVFVQSKEGKWVYVTYQGQEGWCFEEHLIYAE